MARYILYVLKVPLNTKQTNKQTIIFQSHVSLGSCVPEKKLVDYFKQVI